MGAGERVKWLQIAVVLLIDQRNLLSSLSLSLSFSAATGMKFSFVDTAVELFFSLCFQHKMFRTSRAMCSAQSCALSSLSVEVSAAAELGTLSSIYPTSYYQLQVRS